MTVLLHHSLHIPLDSRPAFLFFVPFVRRRRPGLVSFIPLHKSTEKFISICTICASRRLPFRHTRICHGGRAGGMDTWFTKRHNHHTLVVVALQLNTAHTNCFTFLLCHYSRSRCVSVPEQKDEVSVYLSSVVFIPPRLQTTITYISLSQTDSDGERYGHHQNKHKHLKGRSDNCSSTLIS